jgi:hypothetical protein
VKTDDLITMLATGVEPVSGNVAARRMRAALLWGSLGALLILALAFGVRPDLRHASELPMFWVKLGFPGLVAAAALLLLLRLSHPGMRPGAAWLGLALPWAAVLCMAAWALVQAQPEQRLGLVMGATWRVCAFNIALVSSPVFVAVLWAVKGLAPTRLGLAGACAGLLAGAVGAVVYALHCPELEAPFLAVWYVAGMLIPAALGAWLGRRVLRW